MIKGKLAVIGSDSLGWRSVRTLYKSSMPRYFEDVRFFDPEDFGTPFRGGFRSLRLAMNFRKAAQAAYSAGYEKVFVTSFDGGILLPQGGLSGVYGDATFQQLSELRGQRFSLRRQAYQKRIKLLARRGGRVFCMSDWCEQKASRQFLALGITLRNPVDTELFSPMDSGHESKEIFNHRLGQSKIVAVFVGGDLERKGGDLVIEAATQIPEVEFHIVSPNAYSNSPNCHTHTDLKPQSHRLIEVLRNANLFILPSRSDCSPNALAEALSMGLPVITSSVAACPEYTVGGAFGKALKDLSTEALMTAVTQYQDSHDRAVQSLGARLYAEQSFALDVHYLQIAKGMDMIDG